MAYEYCEGAEVVLFGLSKPGMNGLRGVLGAGPNAKGRWPVQLTTLGKSVAIKQENIKLASDDGMADATILGAQQRLIETCLAAFSSSCGKGADGGNGAVAAASVSGVNGDGVVATAALEALCNATCRLSALDCPTIISIALIDAVVSHLISNGDGGPGDLPRTTFATHATLWLKICSRNRPLALHLALPAPFSALVRAATALRKGGANSEGDDEEGRAPPPTAATTTTTKITTTPTISTTTKLASLSSEAATEAIKCIVNVLLQCPTEACQSAIKVGAIHLLLDAAMASPTSFWDCAQDYKVMIVRAVLLLITRSEMLMTAVLDAPDTIPRFAAIAEHILAGPTTETAVRGGEAVEGAGATFHDDGEDAADVQVQVEEEEAKEGRTWPGSAGAAVLVEVLRVYFKLLDSLPLVTAHGKDALNGNTNTDADADAGDGGGAGGGGGGGGGVREEDGEEPAARLAVVARAVFVRAVGADSASFALRDAAVHVLMNTPETLSAQSKYATPALLQGLVLHLERQLELAESKGSSTEADADWAAAVCPVATVLCFTAGSSREARRELRATLLPRIIDRRLGPGRGITTSDKLIKLMTTANGNVRQSVTSLLFVLANQNTARLVRRVGFGNAAGFLQSRGIFQPNDLGSSGGNGESDTDSGGDDGDGDGNNDEEAGAGAGAGAGGNTSSYNPVTGADWDDGPSPTEGMTEDQKEHAAHELLILMDKMNKLGVMKAQMPTTPHDDNNGDD